MGSKTLPEQLKSSLQYHMEQDDVRSDNDMVELFDKLTSLSEKVQAAKQKALRNRQREAALMPAKR
ncbi:hypothetical protein DRW07_03395 [Alteromonas sediminis]|uniref:Uncharacterized protein n=1 Tax=Alteromonas sediminis TaxID=2259342 RepID=A0A3N5ZB47_9ALTE|nr:hypothetical protein [Alteromonas sediminis]RPJ68464.1 hypothetical protein DRW07_03395 [Alteromonas sediminis]